MKANPLRQVYRLTWEDRQYYVKVFGEESWVQKIKRRLWGWPAVREFDLLHLARARGVAVPEAPACGWGQVEGQQRSVLISESLGEVVTLEELIWKERVRDEAVIRNALRVAAETIARMHCAGIEHGDLHAGNLLLEATVREGQGSVGYLTDWQKAHIEPRGGHASANPFQRRRVKQIAILAAALGNAIKEEYVTYFIECYLGAVQPGKELSEAEKQAYINSVRRQARRQDERIKRRYDRRWLRHSRYAGRIKPGQGWQGLVFLEHKHPVDWSKLSSKRFEVDQWGEMVGDMDGVINRAEIIKQGSQNTVRRCCLRSGANEFDVVIKQSMRLPGWRGILQLFRESRARRQWRRAHQLALRGVPTAWPLAMLEKYRYGFRQQSVFIAEALAGVNLREMLLTGETLPRNEPERRKLAEAIGELIARLAAAGFGHRDCKATNLMVQRTDDSGYRVYLVDLDGVYRIRWEGERHYREPLVRLAASMVKLEQVRLKDMARVWRSYLRYLNRPELNNRVARRRLWQQLSAAAVKRGQMTIDKELARLAKEQAGHEPSRVTS